MARIGFIGLGNMGSKMAANLIKAGHTVTGFDLQQEALSAFTTLGGKRAKILHDAAYFQDVIFTMLQTGQQIKQVCLGPQGLFAVAEKNTLYIDCSSIDVQTTKEIHQQAKIRQLLAVDAPVSGGIAGAASASLTFMVGGSEQAFLAAKPILSLLGKQIIHTGETGSGQAAKICNNMILGISMIAISEAFVLAERLGLSAEKLFEVVTHSSGQCWALDHYAPIPGLVDNVPANNNYKPGFSAAMMLKDLKLSQQCANDVKTTTILGEQATLIYELFNKHENNALLDFSAIINAIRHAKE